MLDVIIALLPTTAAGIWFFGMPAVWTIAVCVSTCLAVEAMCRLAMKREGTIGDFSAVLTGLLLALNLPAGLPLWMAALGSVFAITVCKQVFGGLGKNPFNPALAARAFLLISFTGPMTTWLKPYWWKTPDAVTTATPLASMKPMFDAAATTTATPHAGSDGIPALWDLVIGNMPGCIGEVSAIALILGGVYLLFRKVISWHIPVSFIATVWIYSLVSGGAPAHVQVLTGGVLLGAIFGVCHFGKCRLDLLLGQLHRAHAVLRNKECLIRTVVALLDMKCGLGTVQIAVIACRFTVPGSPLGDRLRVLGSLGFNTLKLCLCVLLVLIGGALLFGDLLRLHLGKDLFVQDAVGADHRIYDLARPVERCERTRDLVVDILEILRRHLDACILEIGVRVFGKLNTRTPISRMQASR